MTHRPVVALVGGESLLGREIRDIVGETGGGFELRLIGVDEEHSGTLTHVGDEIALLAALDADSLENARAVLLAGSAESSRKALDLIAADPGAVIIDLTGAAEDLPDARLRAPLAEPEELPAEDSEGVHVIAHPAAIALALFLRRLQAHDPIRRSVIQIFAPASEHGAAGVEELQQQAVSLLSFKSLPKAVFDAQLSFNLLARYGEEAPLPLEDIELRIERHLASLLALPGDGEGAPMPSLRLIQAPVFHGYSLCAWVEFHDDPDIEALESALSTGSIEVRGSEAEAPTNVGQAGQGGIAVGAIMPDRNHADACWFWLVADNLKLVAENAVAVARQIL
jgi:aspartate-semialdehyde dehydrogenase